jgi:hypothetical protein
MEFTKKELAHMFEQAKRDDWHRIFVGSEIRVLIRMAQKSLQATPPEELVLTRSELDALIDFHDYNDAGAEAMDMIEQSKYHEQRSKRFTAMRDALPSPQAPKNVVS